MNIRKKVIFAMTVVAACIVSCKKQEAGPVFPEITDEFQYLGEDNYYLGYNSAEYPGSATLEFKTNLAWHFECEEASEWFDISPVSADAPAKTTTFKVTVSVRSEAAKSAAITLSAKGKSKDFSQVIRLNISNLKPCTTSRISDDMYFSTGCAGRTTSVQQGFDFNEDKSIMYFSQVTSGHRNTIGWGPRTRLTKDPAVTPNMMTLYYYSHANNIRYEKGSDGADYLWIGNYGTINSESKYTSPQILSRIKLQKGKALKPEDASENFYFGVKNLHASFDLPNDQISIYAGYKVKVYRLSEVLKTPVTTVTLEAITYGGDDAPDPRRTYTPSIKAHDCRTLTPLYSFSYNYSPKSWQTYCIHNGKAYFFTCKTNIDGWAYKSVIDIIDFKGNKVKADIYQPFSMDLESLVQYGFTDAETKYMENEGILIRDGVMYLMYTAKNKEGIRRPLVFNLAIPE